MEEEAPAATLPDQVCLFTWMPRNQSTPRGPHTDAGTSNAATPASTDAGNTAQPGGAIPLTPLGDAPTNGAAAGPAGDSAAAAAAAALTSAPTATVRTPEMTPRPAEGPLAAPHILDMLAAQAADGGAAARKSAVLLAGSAVALLRVAQAPAALLREAHERVLPLLQRLPLTSA